MPSCNRIWWVPMAIVRCIPCLSMSVREPTVDQTWKGLGNQTQVRPQQQSICLTAKYTQHFHTQKVYHFRMIDSNSLNHMIWLV
jgi:hypothetical protein